MRNGRDVIERTKRNSNYDLIILSNVLADDTTGDSILKEMQKRKDFKIPVLLHSNDNANRKTYEEMGFNDYLDRHADITKIDTILKKYLNRSKILKERGK